MLVNVFFSSAEQNSTGEPRLMGGVYLGWLSETNRFSTPVGGI